MIEANRDIIEIKMQGLGGQGVVTAVEMVGGIVSRTGYHVQLFSQYGAERRGGRVESYLRLSREKILVHSRVYEADYLILTSKTFISDANIFPNVKEGGTVFINCAKLPEDFSISKKDIRIVTLNADALAIKHGVRLPSGMPIINTTIVGGFAALFPDVEFDIIAEVLREKEVPSVERNIAAAKEAFQYIRQQSEKLTVPEVLGEEIEGIVEMEIPAFKPGLPPCETHCPAGVPIRTFVTLMQKGEIEEASKALRAENPFPGICGRACFHPCETACNRNGFDQAVSINALERAVYDYTKRVPQKGQLKDHLSVKRVAIIGSGPAGISCAYFLRMMGYEVTIFEALEVPGGIPRVGIPAYRLPRRVVDRYMEELTKIDIQMRAGMEVDRELFETIMGTHDACFVATGAHHPLRLNIPGEEGPDVISGLELLKNVALDNHVKVRKRVAVIGGGNTAVDAARTAKRLGAVEVMILYRRSVKEMPAYPEEIKHAREEGIQIMYLVIPVRIHRDGGDIKGLECVRMALMDEGDDGRRKVQPIEGTNFIIDVEGVITAVGENVHVPFLSETVARKNSLIEVDFFGRTSMVGLYAGGDATSFSRTIAHAIGSGKRAAIGIDVFLRGRNGVMMRIFEERGGNGVTMSEYLSGRYSVEKTRTVSLDDLNLDYFEKSPRIIPNEFPPEARISNFQEINRGLSEGKALIEAQRCFRCGECVSCGNCYIFCPDIAVSIEEKGMLPTVNLGFCKGCGICVTECPHGVIQWENR